MIREATLDDAGGIILCWQAAFSEKVKPATVLSKLEADDHLVLVEDCPFFGIVGFCIAYKSKPTKWRVDYVAAHPVDAQRGTGWALMIHTETRAIDAGVTQITLAVRRKNTRAIRLYERLGYQLTEERPAGFSYEKVLRRG